MHLVCLTISAVILNAAFVSAHPSLEKLRRGTSGLSPFPRVGRGGSGARGSARPTWDLALDDYGAPERDPPPKRALYTFPRVGREPAPEPRARLPAPLRLRQLEELLLSGPGRYSKRNSDSGNMWFGPRLGRAAKRDMEEYDEDNSPQESSAFEQSYSEEPEFSTEKKKLRHLN